MTKNRESSREHRGKVVKIDQNQEKEKKWDKKGENRDGSFTFTLLTGSDWIIVNNR